MITTDFAGDAGFLRIPTPVQMGLQHREYLTSTRVFGCGKCRTHLTTIDEMISRQFNGQYGRAYLFETVVNISLGQPEDRPMTTGLHTVRDVRCGKCETILGWKYERAYDETQKYKEGKVILEKELLKNVQ